MVSLVHVLVLTLILVVKRGKISHTISLLIVVSFCYLVFKPILNSFSQQPHNLQPHNFNQVLQAGASQSQANTPMNIVYSGTSGMASLPLHIPSLPNSTIAP